MSLKMNFAKNNQKQSMDFPPLQNKAYLAEIVGVIDLGTHKQEFNERVSYNNLIWIQFELLNESLVDENGKTVPRVIGKQYNHKISERSTLGQHLDALLGDNLYKMESITDIIGQKAYVKVKQGFKDDNTPQYPKIDSIMEVPEEVKPKNAVTEPYVFDISIVDTDTQERVEEELSVIKPSFLQNKIRESYEYIKRFGTAPEEQNQAPEAPISNEPAPKQQVPKYGAPQLQDLDK